MKRDMDLVRQILLTTERTEARYAKVSVPDHPEHLVNYHLDLLISAGIVNGKMHWMNRGRGVAVVNGLTWEGHNYLDAIRDQSIWVRTKDLLRSKGQDIRHLPSEVVFEIVKKVASGEIVDRLNM